jgi:sodium/hydrogen antiporter
MDIQIILIVGAALIIFAAVSKRLQNSFVSAPMGFVLVGLLIGPLGLGIVAEVEPHLIKLVAELTLVLVLFSDAVSIDLKAVCRQRGVPVRLLSIGMPLCILFGALVGLITFPEMFFWEAAILAVILAPTDAALGQAVVSNKKVPVRIRQGLNIESGLNDGIAIPVIFMMLAIACGSSGIVPGDYTGNVWFFWGRFLLLQLVAAPLIGVAVGWLGGWVLGKAKRSQWSSDNLLGLAMVGLALLAFAGAELVHGSGLIAAFVAGLVVGTRERKIASSLHEFTEAEGQILTLLTFMLFGAVLFPEAIEHLTLNSFVYALLSLTLIRIASVFIALAGHRLCSKTMLFIGWFGPRGLASILLVLLVVQNSDLPHVGQISATVMLTVMLSVLLHGVTAVSWAKRYGEWISARVGDAANEPLPNNE